MEKRRIVDSYKEAEKNLTRVKVARGSDVAVEDARRRMKAVAEEAVRYLRDSPFDMIGNFGGYNGSRLGWWLGELYSLTRHEDRLRVIEIIIDVMEKYPHVEAVSSRGNNFEQFYRELPWWYGRLYTTITLYSPVNETARHNAVERIVNYLKTQPKFTTVPDDVRDAAGIDYVDGTEVNEVPPAAESEHDLEWWEERS